MSLKKWLDEGKLQRHQTAPEEIKGLLSLAERDIQNAGIEELDADWRLPSLTTPSFNSRPSPSTLPDIKPIRSAAAIIGSQSRPWWIQWAKAKRLGCDILTIAEASETQPPITPVYERGIFRKRRSEQRAFGSMPES